MAKVIFTERFVQDAAVIWSPRIRENLRSSLESIETFPELGSGLVPQSIKQEFGDNVRKLVVGPFDLVYEYDKDQDHVMIYGLIPQRKIV